MNNGIFFDFYLILGLKFKNSLNINSNDPQKENNKIQSLTWIEFDISQQFALDQKNLIVSSSLKLSDLLETESNSSNDDLIVIDELLYSLNIFQKYLQNKFTDKKKSYCIVFTRSHYIPTLHEQTKLHSIDFTQYFNRYIDLQAELGKHSDQPVTLETVAKSLDIQLSYSGGDNQELTLATQIITKLLRQGYCFTPIQENDTSNQYQQQHFNSFDNSRNINNNNNNSNSNNNNSSNRNDEHEDIESRLYKSKGETFVLIRGMPWSTTEEKIRDFFDPIPIMPNGITILLNSHGKQSGEAYIEFIDENAAKESMEYHKKMMGHRYIEVMPKPRSTAINALRRDGQNHHVLTSKIVRMRGLPYNITIQNIINFFTGYTIRNNNIFIEMDNSGRVTGEGFVEFNTFETASAALKHLQHKTIANRYIELFPHDKHVNFEQNRFNQPTQHSQHQHQHHHQFNINSFDNNISGSNSINNQYQQQFNINDFGNNQHQQQQMMMGGMSNMGGNNGQGFIGDIIMGNRISSNDNIQPSNMMMGGSGSMSISNGGMSINNKYNNNNISGGGSGYNNNFSNENNGFNNNIMGNIGNGFMMGNGGSQFNTGGINANTFDMMNNIGFNNNMLPPQIMTQSSTLLPQQLNIMQTQQFQQHPNQQQQQQQYQISSNFSSSSSFQNNNNNIDHMGNNNSYFDMSSNSNNSNRGSRERERNGFHPYSSSREGRQGGSKESSGGGGRDSNRRERDRGSRDYNSSSNSGNYKGDSSNHDYTVKLRGLPYSTTEDEISDFFSGINVKSIKIIYQRGRPSGLAYVTLSTSNDYHLALKRNNHHIGSRYIEVFGSND